MCRAFVYLGNSIALDSLISGPSHSLMEQTYAPKQMSGILNLAGFGMALWSKQFNHTQMPLIYHSTTLPFYDKNLHSLAKNQSTECILAHIRGTPHQTESGLSLENIHPYYVDNVPLVLAHNGHIFEYHAMIPHLMPYFSDLAIQHLDGSSDTQWLFALFISQLKDPFKAMTSHEIVDALKKTIQILKKIRKKEKIHVSSPLNLFLTNGQFVVALRYTLDYGKYTNYLQQNPTTYHSLWYTYGKNFVEKNNEYEMTTTEKHIESLIVSSEPLSKDITTWIEIPEYSVITAEKKENHHIQMTISDIGL